MLSIGRPYSVCIISRRGGQSLQTGPVGPDRVNVIVIFTKAGESDEIAFWRPGRKIIKSRSKLCLGSIVHIDDPKTVFRLLPKAKHDSLTVRRPARKPAVSVSLGEFMEFRAIRAHQHNAGRPAAREKVETSSKSDPLIVRRPLRRQ